MADLDKYKSLFETYLNKRKVIVDQDKKAKKEYEHYEKLVKEEGFKNQLTLSRTFRKIFKIMALLLLVLFVIKLWHLAAPECLGWLTKEQLQNLSNILSSGVIGGVIGKQLDIFYKKDDKN
jgi:hypothetical protein